MCVRVIRFIRVISVISGRVKERKLVEGEDGQSRMVDDDYQDCDGAHWLFETAISSRSAAQSTSPFAHFYSQPIFNDVKNAGFHAVPSLMQLHLHIISQVSVEPVADAPLVQPRGFLCNVETCSAGL